ncbi:hypothetical protein [Brevibacterium jeotgali]|uniref:ABC-2 family transporter protein n=1 Tax=Brevibacterium jeotgali TaxID=1262550 RepID=A0A2H1L1U7_9MICO|nr:hypothetical protein [Brevibacterium jeotgali]TWC01944.1 hypothetical protein FB108_0604 [Brevibacterium jeotgali]SMY10705.1 hypothetical protein BJEO58_00278 [Brevibacterium jeotgali]
MITTLLAHEWQRTRVMVGAVTGIALLVVGAAALLIAPGWPGLSLFGILLGAAVLCGYVPVLQVLLAVDYWRSSYGRTGYFTQTLPIRGGTIFAAKFLHMNLVILAGLLVTVLLVPLYWWGLASGGMVDLGLFAAVRELWATITAVLSPLLMLGAVAAFLGLMLSGQAMYTFSASIGSETPINRLGFGGPVVVYLVLYGISQVLTFAALFAIPLGIGMTGDGLGLVRFDVLAEVTGGAESDEVMPVAFLAPLLLIGALCVWRTAHSWNRKVALT